MNDSDNKQEAQKEEVKCKQRNRGKKRKRSDSESSTDIEDILPENTLEVEKNLHASAIKNNLDDVSVKKILKKVVTNDHVLALVKLREEEEDSGTEENLQPKITRAKAKELMKASPKSAPWTLELTPIKHIPVKTRPEVKALIAQELPDDEDDEEYEPTHDDSDDDHVLESSSDVDSLPRTPATPKSQKNTTPKVVNDGPFKVPQQQEVSTPVRRKLTLEEEPTIALRTRSKLSLSATSIEHIESSFVPPDDLPMPDVDSLWNDFLNDCLNPASNARNEDDDEADPEYNVAADPDANEEDEESLENSIIKISRKELNDLVTELFNIMPDTASETPDNLVPDNLVQDMLTEHTTLQTEQTTLQNEVPPRWEGKQEPVSDEENAVVTSRPAPIAAKTERFSIGKCEPTDQQEEQITVETQPENENHTEQTSIDTSSPPHCEVVAAAPSGVKQPPGVLRTFGPKPQPIRVEIQKDSCNILPEQVSLLQQQLRQHVQLAAGSYLQLYVHPSHWAKAPAYKEYLVSLEKMVQKIPLSVVNVCNLRPALELIAGWEKAVSADTKENIEMVEFIQKEEERRRRLSSRSNHVGDFPEMFLKVIANSPVFLYPHLLPATPFRPDTLRRTSFLKSEDELIALGMDQFWKYVYANPEVFKKPSYVHPRHRWGLAATLQLVSDHMMPWMTLKTLMAHVRHVKKAFDKDNPIYKFFQTGEVCAVKHSLLPFNPRLTLYEQPEHEVPRIWVRYLARSSSRFKRFLYSQKKSDAITPSGIDVNVNVEVSNKVPLPIEFNKELKCSRLNLLPKPSASVDRIDVAISLEKQQPMVAQQIYTVLSTSNGSFLVPLQLQTATVNATASPVCSTQESITEKLPDFNNIPENDRNNTEVEGTKTAERSNFKEIPSFKLINSENSEHCSCCVQIRSICKRKSKKTIVDYFKANKSDEPKCECKGKKYPKMTNRLKLLLKNYRTHAKCMFAEIHHKLTKEADDNCEDDNDSLIRDDDENDLVIATLFQLKLTTAVAVTRNNYLKKRIHTLFSKFDINTGDVVTLARQMELLCEEELIEYFKEFTGFLTAEQADIVGHYKDYFVARCMEKVIKKIEELVPDKQKRCSMLWFLKSKFLTTAFQCLSACEMCSALLWMVDGHPPLAQYVFDLFPHRHDCSEQPQQQDPQPEPAPTNKEIPADNVNDPVETNTAMDYEADHSSSGEEEEDVETNEPTGEAVKFVNRHENTPVKVEEEEIVHNKSRDEASKDALDTDARTIQSIDSDTDRLIMSDEETIIKTECPEWKRDEDKVILEVLKSHSTPEERRDKTILEVLEETQALAMISDSLPYKSMSDIKERILYLLQLLVSSDLLQ